MSKGPVYQVFIVSKPVEAVLGWLNQSFQISALGPDNPGCYRCVHGLVGVEATADGDISVTFGSEKIRTLWPKQSDCALAAARALNTTVEFFSDSPRKLMRIHPSGQCAEAI